MQTQLTKTAARYQSWCEGRTGPITSAPVELQRSIVKLLEHYPWAEVCETVGINRSLLGSWRKAHRDGLKLKSRKQTRTSKQPPKMVAPKTTPVRADADFIEVSPVTATSALEVEIRFRSGAVILARAANAPRALGDFVTRVLASAEAHT